MENLFTRNIYSEEDLEKIENLINICNYYNSFEKFIKFIPVVANALACPHWITEKEKLEDFMLYDLNDAYSHLGEVKEAIHELKVIKKLVNLTI